MKFQKLILTILCLSFGLTLFLQNSYAQSGGGGLSKKLQIIGFDDDDRAIIDCSLPGNTCIIRPSRGGQR